MSWKTEIDSNLKLKATLLLVISACLESRGDMLNKFGNFFEKAFDGEKNAIKLDGNPYGQYSYVLSATDNEKVSFYRFPIKGGEPSLI